MGIVVFLGVEIFVLAPLVLAYVPSKLVQLQVLEGAPFLGKIIEDKETIVGFETPGGNFWIHWFIYQLAAVILAAVVILVVVNIGSLLLIRSRKTTMSMHTLRLNMTLYRAMSVQMVGAIRLGRIGRGGGNMPLPRERRA